LAYLPKALILAKSVKRFHPDWDFHILLNDELPEALIYKIDNVDRIVTSASLNIDNFHSWTFGLNVVEYCCATKPFYFKQLLLSGYNNVIYLDPDTKLFSRSDYILSELDRHDVLITPHNDRPAIRDSEIMLTERSVLAHGIYNLGFLAARATQKALEVVEFWRSRLVRYCHDDQRNGLFTDQKWFNLIPIYFDCVKTLRHEGCNVASWNISHRPISDRGGKLFSGKDELIFFHFSGYDAQVPRQMFETFGEYNDILASMLSGYGFEVQEYSRAFAEAHSPWVFGSFDNSVAVPESVRRFYRSSLNNRVIYPEPYFTNHERSFFSHVTRIGLDTIEERFRPEKYG
jgi:hypothetical protein